MVANLLVVLTLLIAVIAWAYTQPTPERQRAGLRTGLGLLAVLCILAALRPILLPFVVPLVVAYLLDPVLDWFEAQGRPRVIGVVLVYILLIVLTIGAIVLLVPPILSQINKLASDLMRVQWERLVEPEWVRDRLIWIVQRLPGDHDAGYKLQLSETITANIQQLSSQWRELTPSLRELGNWLSERAKSAFNWAFTTFTGLLWVALLPITLWYCLIDFDKMRRRAWYITPPERRPEIGQLAGALNRAIGNYLRGYAILCLMVGMTTTILMVTMEGFFDSSYGLVVGVIAGLTYFVPYLGSLTSVFLGTLVIYITGGNQIGETLIAFLLLQGTNSIYDNVVSPRIIGKQVGLHPMLVMFGLLAGGKLLGLAGIILATPMLLCIKVILEHYFPRLTEPIPDTQNPDIQVTDEHAHTNTEDPEVEALASLEPDDLLVTEPVEPEDDTDQPFAPPEDPPETEPKET